MNEIDELRERLAKFEAENKQLKFNNIVLAEQLKLLTKKLFGSKSEKKDNNPDLFNEAEYITETKKQEAEPETIEIKYNRKKGKYKIKDGWENLPVNETIIDIPEDEKICACKNKMSVIGSEKSEKLKIIPMQIEVERTVRLKYACLCCEGVESEGIHPTVKIAPPKPSILPKSFFSSSLLTFILINKLCDGLPFYRQEKIFNRVNIKLSRATMCYALINAYSKCGIIENLMIKNLLKSYYIGIDETTVQVLKEPGKPPESKSYMWVFRGGTAENPIIIFYYDPSRSGAVPNEFLSGYQGRIQTDGYSGYNLIGNIEYIIHYGCWAHSRRKFIEAIEVSKERNGIGNEIIGLIGKLYEIEKNIKIYGYLPDEVKKYRQKHSKPILKEIKNIALENISQVPPQTKLGIALNYMIFQWEKLEKYADDGIIPIDNNFVENAIRPFVIGRKNWLFYDTQNGARASAFFYSLIETAKANKLEPFSYLNYIFEEIPYCKNESDYEKLLPMFVDKTKIKTYIIPD